MTTGFDSSAGTVALDIRSGIRLRHIVLVSLCLGAILLTRHPAALLHAEFWGEDGWFWYPDAYNFGYQSLLWPRNGYLQTISRLGGLMAQPFPLAWAPTIFALIAFIIQVSPAAFLVSSRMSRSWTNFPARLAFALIYIALPNAFEVSINLTNAQWHLAILAFLVLVSDAPDRWWVKVFDGAVLILSGLSGPFCIFLLPVSIWQFLEERSRTNLWRAGLVFATVLVQGCCILFTMHASRSAEQLGANLDTLARILSLQILIGSLLGQHMMAAVTAWHPWQTPWLPRALASAGLMLTVIAFLRGPPLLRKACLFAGLLLASALIHPQVSDTEPQWVVMTQPGMGDRYYVIPMLAWFGVLFSLAASSRAALRCTGIVLLGVGIAAGIPGDWKFPYMSATGFAEQARAFSADPPGTHLSFGIHPPGASPMVLVKKNPG